ncbi:MAG: hypothetical protein ACKO3H_11065 [Verrucomicrobiota bacterium]
MNFTVHSQMMNEVMPSSPRLIRRVVLSRTLRGVAWLVLPFCYLGVLLAPTVVLSIPFQVLHRHAVSPVVFWSTTAAMSALVLWLFYRSARTASSAWRQRIIHVEAIVMCMALVLSVLLIAWVFPPR